MKKIGTKQIVPLVLAVFAVVFAVVGFTQLGFWEDVDGPQPGFFPAIMAIVMFLASIASFFQSLKEEKAARYERDEMMVIGGSWNHSGFLYYRSAAQLLFVCDTVAESV